MKKDRLAKLLKENQKDDAKFKPVQGLIEDRGKFIEIYEKHLNPCGEDLILLTLTGHLIIESILDTILQRQLDIACLPTGHPLEFSQKVDLVEAIVISREPKPNADIFCAVRKLNSIRNDLAHKLMHKSEIEAAVKKVIQSYQSNASLKLPACGNLSKEFKSCITRLCGFLDSVIVHLYKLEMEKIKMLTD